VTTWVLINFIGFPLGKRLWVLIASTQMIPVNLAPRRAARKPRLISEIIGLTIASSKQLSETGKDGTTLARFKLGKQLLACRLGELTLARFPLCVARLEYMSQIPDEESAHDRMFLQLLNRKFDGIYLESINPGSPLWRYVQTSRLIQGSFFRYSQRDPSPHLLIRLNGTFSDYLKRLSAKTRKNRLREIRIVRLMRRI
jgi:hypothetical protein